MFLWTRIFVITTIMPILKLDPNLKQQQCSSGFFIILYQYKMLHFDLKLKSYRPVITVQLLLSILYQLT